MVGIQCQDRIKALIDRGEGQDSEFMASFPNQATDLGKEIAAFATSNAGTILLGVQDDGVVIGLNNAKSTGERDALMRRVEGITTGQVQPSITPLLEFCEYEEKTVMILDVPKGSEPVYYCQGRPYLRHLSSSRPAAPHEARDLVVKWAEGLRGAAIARTEDPQKQFTLAVLSELTNGLMWLEDVEDPDEVPDLRQMQAQLGEIARALAGLSASDEATRLGIAEKLKEIAASLQRMASHRFAIDGSRSFESFRQAATETLRKISMIVDELTQSSVVDDSYRSDWKSAVRRRTGELELLASHLDEVINTRGGTDSIKGSLSDLGFAFYQLGVEADLVKYPKHISDLLRGVGRKLRRLGNFRFYLDGGKSYRRFQELLGDAVAEARAAST